MSEEDLLKEKQIGELLEKEDNKGLLGWFVRYLGISVIKLIARIGLGLGIFASMFLPMYFNIPFVFAILIVIGLIIAYYIFSRLLSDLEREIN